MIGWIRNRLNRDEGFTLVELMVVVLVIAILIAIAIPTFLGARQRAQDRAAQSDLRNGLTAAKVYYVDNEEYGASEASDADFQAALNGIEPSLAFDGTDVTTIRGDQTVQFWMESASGTFFGILDNAAAGGGTFYCTGVQADVDGTNACANASW